MSSERNQFYLYSSFHPLPQQLGDTYTQTAYVDRKLLQFELNITFLPTPYEKNFLYVLLKFLGIETFLNFQTAKLFLHYWCLQPHRGQKQCTVVGSVMWFCFSLEKGKNVDHRIHYRMANT
jgi:hypothetical protein